MLTFSGNNLQPLFFLIQCHTDMNDMVADRLLGDTDNTGDLFRGKHFSVNGRDNFPPYRLMPVSWDERTFLLLLQALTFLCVFKAYP